MSGRAPEISEDELRTVQAVMRGQPPDIDALASLLGTTLTVARSATDPNVDILLQRAVLRSLVGRLSPAHPVDIADIDVAFITVGVLEEARTPMTRAPDITAADLATIGAAMRSEPVTCVDLAMVLGHSPSEIRNAMEPACGTDATDDILTIVLLLRLSGRRVDLHELAMALVAVQTEEFRRAMLL